MFYTRNGFREATQPDEFLRAREGDAIDIEGHPIDHEDNPAVYYVHTRKKNLRAIIADIDIACRSTYQGGFTLENIHFLKANGETRSISELIIGLRYMSEASIATYLASCREESAPIVRANSHYLVLIDPRAQRFTAEFPVNELPKAPFIAYATPYVDFCGNNQGKLVWNIEHPGHIETDPETVSKLEKLIKRYNPSFRQVEAPTYKRLAA